MDITPLEKSNILIEALPYVNKFRDSIFIIKYGGNAMINDILKDKVMEDLHMLKSVGIHPVLIHGGGPEINAALKQYQVESHFVDGLRVTDERTMEIVEMVLTGRVNKDIVGRLIHVGASAVGLSGKDARLIEATKKRQYRMNDNGEREYLDLGFVGEVKSINTSFLISLLKDGHIPVIASIGIGPNGESYNINADYVAGAIARELKACKFMLLTDVEGIFEDFNDKTSLVTRAKLSEIEKMKEDGTITGGMIPKVDCCIYALEGGVERAHIIDGRLEHSILLEIFSKQGIGTMIER